MKKEFEDRLIEDFLLEPSGKNELLQTNQIIIKIVDDTNKMIEAWETHLEQLRKKLVAPCEHCPYDGEYRCQACEEDNYAGFNVAEFPRES